MGRKLRQYAPPTNKQLDVWDALDRLTITELMPPSIIDLMVECDMTSKSVILARLKRGVIDGRVATISTRGGTKYVPAWWFEMIRNETDNYYEERK
jgi:hypothetical protein